MYGGVERRGDFGFLMWECITCESVKGEDY